LLFLATTVTVNADRMYISEMALKAEAEIKQLNGYDYEILWSKDWLDGEVRDTTGGQVATDSNNNVIVHGYSKANEQHVLVKYDINGTQLWEIFVDYDGFDNIESLESYVEEPQMPAGYENCTNEMMQISSNEDIDFGIHDICTDNEDNIILMGRKDIVGDEPPDKFYVAMLKYDSDGNEIWKNLYDYNDWLLAGLDMAVDSDGSIFIPCTHYVWSYILKLDSDGSVDWFGLATILPPWLALSVALDSNEEPVVAAIYLMFDPEGSTMFIGFAKFNSDTGDKLADGVLEIPRRDTMFSDAALTVDTSDNSVFFGFIDYIYKIDASFNEIIWQKPYTCCINDLKVIDEKLVTCGGWCNVNDVTNYYAAVYNKNSGTKLFDMALGELLYSDDPFFQGFLNQMYGMSIDNNGDILQAGGEGGIRTIKFRITSGMMLGDSVLLL